MSGNGGVWRVMVKMWKKAETTGYKALEKNNWRPPENKLFRDKFLDYTVTDLIMLLKLWH